MSITLRLVLAFAAVTVPVFGLVGFAAVRASGNSVEIALEARIDATLRIVRDRQDFFLFEAASRERELRQLAAISGFEIVVGSPSGRGVDGSSLPREVAERFLALAPDEERFVADLDATEYRGARARLAGRTVWLLSAAAPIARAKEEAARPVVLFSGAGLLVVVVLGALFARTVTKPLRRLADRVSEVREGRLDVELPRGGGREIQGLSAAFGEMLAGLAKYREELVAREKLATLGRFSAAVAHELRNPLSALRMTAQMLRDEAPEAMRGELDVLLSEMERLDHAVEELLFHAGTPRYAMRDIDLRDTVSATVRTLTPLAEHLGIRLEERRPEAPVTARGDPEKLRQALMNLVLNAVQASPPDAAVTVGAAARESEAELTVEDSGPGVPPEIGERIWEPFVSGREGGTGLGLSVAKAIAGAHGGNVGHARREGRTTFRLTVPRG